MLDTWWIPVYATQWITGIRPSQLGSNGIPYYNLQGSNFMTATKANVMTSSAFAMMPFKFDLYGSIMSFTSCLGALNSLVNE